MSENDRKDKDRQAKSLIDEALKRLEADLRKLSGDDAVPRAWITHLKRKTASVTAFMPVSDERGRKRRVDYRQLGRVIATHNPQLDKHGNLTETKTNIAEKIGCSYQTVHRAVAFIDDICSSNPSIEATDYAEWQREVFDGWVEESIRDSS